MVFSAGGDGASALLFLYAKQKPFEVHFLQLRRRTVPIPLWACTTNDRDLAERDDWLHCFEILDGFCDHTQMPFLPDAPLYVVDGVFFDRRSGCLVGHTPGEELYQWLSSFPLSSDTKADSSGKKGRLPSEPM